jgi:hypothetical protein
MNCKDLATMGKARVHLSVRTIECCRLSFLGALRDENKHTVVPTSSGNLDYWKRKYISAAASPVSRSPQGDSRRHFMK